MTTAAMREQLINFLAEADERKIVALYTLLEENMQEDLLTKEQWHMVEERRVSYQAGNKSDKDWRDLLDSYKDR